MYQNISYHSIYIYNFYVSIKNKFNF
jgi:hypothetical protein